MKTRCFIILTIAAALIASIAVAAENKGAGQISINGGSRGNVSFPHHAHQERLKDCGICHAVFPQEQGALDRLKGAGQLKPKEVMNKQCIKCHKEQKLAGNTKAPTTCSTCHVK